MKLLFPSTFSSLAVRITVALLIITSCIVKNISATSHDDTSSQSSSSITNEDDTSINDIITGPSNHLLLEQFNATTNGLSLNDDDQWVQLGDPIRGKERFDFFGRAVAISKSGKFVIIGGYNNDDNGSDAGIAQIYQYNENREKWEKVGGDILGEKAGDRAGVSVDMNDAGDVVIIGSPHSANKTGYAQVFRLINGQWSKQGQDLIGTANSWFGYNVAISSDGGTVIVSGPHTTGYVKVYQYNPDTQRWEQLGLTIVAENADDWFGFSVDMNDSGDAIIIGAPDNDGKGTNSGHARVFRYIDGQWIQQGQDIGGRKQFDIFGRDVAISDDGETVIIGSPSDYGYAQVYQYKDDTQRWEQVGSDITGEKESDQLGWAVDMNSKGDAIIVSAPYHDGNDKEDSGYARVYQLIDRQWVQKGQDLHGWWAKEFFGLGVAISGNGEKVIIGAPYNDEGYVRAFIFNKPPTAQPSSMPSIQPSLTKVPSMTPSIFCSDSPLKVITKHIFCVIVTVALLV